MAKTTMTQDERQLVKLVEKLPATEEEKNRWLEQIRAGDMSQELADEIRQMLTQAVENETEQKAAARQRYLAELTLLVKRWRLSSQSRNFQRNR